MNNEPLMVYIKLKSKYYWLSINKLFNKENVT